MIYHNGLQNKINSERIDPMSNPTLTVKDKSGNVLATVELQQGDYVQMTVEHTKEQVIRQVNNSVMGDSFPFPCDAVALIFDKVR